MGRKKKKLPEWVLLLLSLVLGSGPAVGVTVSEPPPPACPATCSCPSIGLVDCYNARLIHVPEGVSNITTNLDLARNNISRLPDFVFSKFQYLEDLNLASNGIEELTPLVFHGLIRLKELSLQDNNLTNIPWEALKSIESLEALRLDGNFISSVAPESLAPLAHIVKLWLGHNLLTRVPVDALAHLHQLEALDLGGNDIAQIEDHAFRNLTRLVILVLENNRITTIAENAFSGLENLKVLELNDNYLKKVPPAITSLPALEHLTVADNEIVFIEDEAFSQSEQLVTVEFKGNPIKTVGKYAFHNMTKLKKLIISAARELEEFPDLNGTESLEILRIDRAKLFHVPNDLCKIARKLKSLDLKSNIITRIPILTECKDLRLIDLSGNQIQTVKGSLFSHQSNLHDLLLGNNLIEVITADTFSGLHKLQILDLVNNKIDRIDPDAFLPLKQIEDMNLGNNRFPHLPSRGLENVRQLKAFNNKYLKEFPGPPSFPRIQVLALSYAYHCCEFLPLVGGIAPRPLDVDDVVIWPPKDKMPDMSLWSGNNTDIWPAFDNLTARFGEFAEEIWGNFGPDYTYPANLPQYIEDYFEDYRSQHSPTQHERFQVHCLPQPGPFMPCEDLFDWWTLRCGIWIVFLLAMLGNGTVVFVLVFSRSKMDVPRFLVCNLALADFFMGIYLGFLAVVDASTLGHFKMHAIRWQTSAGCQMAGFLGVLSSELSVYTLAVITMERNYAITHAMHLNKRLSLKHAAYIMSCGWSFAAIVASLPLFGISDYRKFAICLPFETEDSWSLAYVVFLMSVNGVAFLILMGCYLKMYCAIRGSQAWNSNDSRIAKRMALLVFTDFVCWAPIAFFSLTAAFGLHLISLEEAKVFTIFVLPLNSCANPFLYAILTKQFKKDCVLICKAIEESRVTRGIGRCRHSSNFSNRQTPANTNSVVGERNSSNNGQICSCNLKSGDSDKPGSGTNGSLRKPWRFSTVRYLLCDGGMDRDQDSSNDYAYALAEIQRGQQKHKKRDSSVSSENFSSSRSDSWRNRGSVPLRLLEKRRRNSWTITRKPSQDSNLSNSRNDSSATTASTSTWRISRSSVSSDSSAARPASATKVPITPNPVPPQTDNVGISRYNRDSSLLPRQVPPSPPSLPVGARPRPKLQRQAAFNEDALPSPPTLIRDPSKPSGEMGTDQQELQACFALSSMPQTQTDNAILQSLPSNIMAQQTTGLHPTQSLAGFVPRKLSTISSRSCSMNRENSGLGTTQSSTEDIAPPPSSQLHYSKNPRSLSLLTLPSGTKLPPRRFASDDALKTDNANPICSSDQPLLDFRNPSDEVHSSSDDDEVFSKRDSSLVRFQAAKPQAQVCVPMGPISKESEPLLDNVDSSAEPT